MSSFNGVIKVTTGLKGEVATAFTRYLLVKNFKISTAVRYFIVKGLVEEGYLPTWWLENNLSRQK